MKYITTLTVTFLFCFTTVLSQNSDNKTNDLGIELLWQPDGLLLNIQFAYNLKAHHTFIFRAGYNKIQTGSIIHNAENGDGWGGSLGYRYYVKDVPLKFFCGLRIDACKMNIHWTNKSNQEGDTELAFIQPTIEAGYTFLFKNKFFVTPLLNTGYQIKIYSRGENIAYGKGIISQAGISTGWRF